MFYEPDEVSLPASRAACFAHTVRGHPTLVMDVLCVVPSCPPPPCCRRPLRPSVGGSGRLHCSGSWSSRPFLAEHARYES